MIEGSIRLSGGRHLDYFAIGPADAPAVLYCHGTPGSRLELLLAQPALERNQVHMRLIGLNRPEPLPSRSAVYRALLRHNLVDPQQRRKRRSDYRRWERDRAMELWQMDIMGGVFLADGSELKVVTGIDDHSRFCVSAKVVRRATARPVCDALADAMRLHGIPNQVLTDNGKVFTGRFGPGKGEVLFDRICRENGVRHLLTAPRSPTTTGKVERFHKTLKKDFLAGKTFKSLEEAQAAIDDWVVEYNTVRPHQGIGMAPPIRRFELAVAEPFEVIIGEDEPPAPESVEVATEPRRVTRKIGRDVTSYGVLGAWTVAGWAATAWVVGRRG